MKEHKKLENQPLQYVLAEFKFSQVFQIKEFIPQLQEGLRKRYPIPHKRNDQTIHLQPDGLSVTMVERWTFVSADKKSAIDISPERVIYTSVDYPDFSAFANACKEVLGMLEAIVEPGLILRIGLRYGDLVTVDGDEDITCLVDEHFIFPRCLGSFGRPNHHSTETVLDTEIGKLVIRTLYGRHNLTFMPDLQGLPIAIKQDNENSERVILDFDHFWEAGEEPVSFSTDILLEKLEKLHGASIDAFWSITTEYARDKKWA